ncbi:hypothetical protein FJ987_09595 [Mesorhizobium sp. CU2]|uniref:hypothetical protein n=1 Tax=unclassified Mesorhizobium TaxID=325217 RepID=UPI001126B2A0|nr:MULTISPECIES: hypothetical protein [unclassified Mesorhizobium]TPN86407.1 hypothetical protein FJ988_06360 [Mesorhizobium sp. CU3]TPO17186.1 hypothetical protein FJ987_09595 [Mesorhizobium sp. CU2]
MHRIGTRYLKIFTAGLAFGFYLVAASIRGWGTEPLTDFSNDAVILTILKGGIVFALIFTLGHLVLRQLGIIKAWAYAALGTVCALPLFISHLASGTFAELAATGNVSTGLFIPACVGATIGLAYRKSAGIDGVAEDLDGMNGAYRGLAFAAGETGTGSHGQSGRGQLTFGKALAAAGTVGAFTHKGTEYFDGPLRVRTSLLSLLGASLLGAVLSTVIQSILDLGSYMRDLERMGKSIRPGNLFDVLMSDLVVKGAMALFTGVPVLILIAVAHFGLRSMGKTGYLGYGIAGLLVAPIMTLVTFGAAGPLLILATLPTVLGAVIYRKFAGLEPVPIAEDIVAKNRRDLVGADHARRKAGRVIIS